MNFFLSIIGGLSLLGSACKTVSPFVEHPNPPSLVIVEDDIAANKEIQNNGSDDLAADQIDFVGKKTVTIPLHTQSGFAEVNADIYRPQKKAVPKTIAILVPGSGEISREGELTTDGISIYKKPVLQSALLAQELAFMGIFGVTYDKRTCQPNDNQICNNNDQKDIKSSGIKALANDLDSVCQFVKENNKDADYTRIILLGFNQSAQVIALSQCLKEASKIILVAPILEGLDVVWPRGLTNIIEQKTDAKQKNKWLNRLESTKIFLSSLEQGQFPDDSQIRGTSVIFWQSWLETSKKTIEFLNDSGKEVLIVYSENDPYYADEISDKIGEKMVIKKDKHADRNLILNNGISKNVIKIIREFLLNN